MSLGFGETLAISSVTAGVAIIGWFIGHWLSAARDQKNRRNELRTTYLTTTYQRLASAVYRGSIFHALEEVQSSVADIYLLGTESQIQHVEEFVQAIDKRKYAEADRLLIALCNDLRGQLHMPPIHREKLLWIVRENGQGQQKADNTGANNP